MKQIVAYAVVRRIYYPGWEVVGVVSENRWRVYGSTANGGTTNRAKRDVLARFATEAQADAAVLHVQEVYAAHKDRVDAADRALKASHTARTDAVAAAFAQCLAMGAPKAAPVSGDVQAPACNMPA